MSQDNSPLVEITVHATDILFTNCEYPEPTKEMIIDKMREMLDEGNITYSEKRHPQTTITSAIQKINKEPISSVLETFGDIDDVISESERMQEDLEPIGVNNTYISHDVKQSHTTTGIGRSSTEQGGNRNSAPDPVDRDPFNE